MVDESHDVTRSVTGGEWGMMGKKKLSDKCCLEAKLRIMLCYMSGKYRDTKTNFNGIVKIVLLVVTSNTNCRNHCSSSVSFIVDIHSCHLG